MTLSIPTISFFSSKLFKIVLMALSIPIIHFFIKLVSMVICFALDIISFFHQVCADGYLFGPRY